jgi:amidase
MHPFNPLTATVGDVQQLLENGSTTSVEVVEMYLEQIAKYNHAGPKLNALISVAPRHLALERALFLDAERVAGRARGPLHGIPFIVKENMLSRSDMGMSNTAGSWAFVGAVSAQNADLVDKMLDAGMILIGKGSLTVSLDVDEKALLMLFRNTAA